MHFSLWQIWEFAARLLPHVFVAPVLLGRGNNRNLLSVAQSILVDKLILGGDSYD